MDLGLRGRVCVVTGASRGIGLAVSAQLAAEGATVLMVARDLAALDSARREIERGAPEHERPALGRLEPLALDITGGDAAARIEAACAEHLGTIEVLVNNAGATVARGLQELSDEDWQQQWELNVMAPMRLMRGLAPGMAERGWGRIVNVSSSSGKRPSLRNAAYSVTKAAELSLSRAFADAYARQGVLVNAVTPGMVATELWMGPGGLLDQTAAELGVTREQALRAQADRLPIGRLAEPEQIAAVIVFLCSELAANVAGAAWSVDGGTVPVII